MVGPSALAELACVCSRNLIKQDKIEDWDFSILTHLLLFNSVWGGWLIPQNKQCCTNELRSIRNSCIRHSTGIVTSFEDVDQVESLLRTVDQPLTPDDAAEMNAKIHETRRAHIVDIANLPKILQVAWSRRQYENPWSPNSLSCHRSKNASWLPQPVEIYSTSRV